MQWAKNPQYVLELDEHSEVFISLTQRDGRLQPPAESLSQDLESFPFKNIIHSICFAVMRLHPGQVSAHSLEESQVERLSPLKLHREVHLRMNLKPGVYAIVPATQNAGSTGTFWLSVYLNCPKRKARLYESGKLSNKGTFIQEEEEETVVPLELLDDMKILVDYIVGLS